MRQRELSVVYPRKGSGAFDSFNLMTDFSLENSIILLMEIIFRGTMTSTGGGAISGFHRDAPCGIVTTMKMWGNYQGGVRKNLRTLFDMPSQQMFYPGVYLSGVFNALLRTSSGASSTDPFRAVIPVPLIDPLADTAGATYIDCRDYTSLKLDVRWDVDANLATTNLSSVQAVEAEIKLVLAEEGPPRGTPHYEPNVVYKEMPASVASTRLVEDGDVAWDGDLWSLWMQQFDDSAAGDAERVDGLVRAVSLEHGKGEAIPFSRWDPLRRSTWAKYNYTQSTTEIAGVAAASFRSRPRRARNGKLLVVRNTTEANPPGVTAITPGASDALFTTLVAAEPVYGRQGK